MIANTKLCAFKLHIASVRSSNLSAIAYLEFIKQNKMEDYTPKNISTGHFVAISDNEGEVWSDKLAKAIGKSHNVLYKYFINEGARDSRGVRFKRCFMDIELFDKVLGKNEPWTKKIPQSIDYTYKYRKPRKEVWDAIIYRDKGLL